MEIIPVDRKLINFVDHLSELGEIEDMFKYINDQLVKLESVSNIVLCISPSKNRQVIYFKERQKVFMHAVESLWLQDINIRFDHIKDSQFLANNLKRPVGQIVAFPIKMKQLESLCKNEVPATIFIEHSCSKEGQDLFIKKLINYIQPIQFSLEKTFLQLFLSNAAIEWQNTFDGLKDPICIVDNDFNLMRANKAFYKSNIKGIKCFEAIFSRNDICVGCPIKEDRSNNEERVSTLNDGSKVYEVRSYPVHKKSEHDVKAFVNHYVDITQSQNLKGKMLQGEKLAVIGQLAENISHELNNPLTGIKSLADIIISEDECGDQMIGDLKEVSAAAERCQNIINSLMMFSNENSQSQRKQVLFNDQVKVAMTLAKSVLAGKELHYDFSDQSTLVYVIPELMVQVIFNLIQNSCQATSDKGIIKLKTIVKNNHVEMTVTDNGAGINKEIINDIFKPFFTTKKIGEGTGLGLSMSLGIIKSFDGTLKVTSEEGQGAEFIIQLPLRAEN